MNIAAIISPVCLEFGITRAQLMSRDRHGPLVRVRQAAMSLARELTGKSLPRIAAAFERSDHSTILCAVVRTQQRIRVDPDLVARMDRVRIAVLRGAVD